MLWICCGLSDRPGLQCSPEKDSCWCFDNLSGSHYHQVDLPGFKHFTVIRYGYASVFLSRQNRRVERLSNFSGTLKRPKLLGTFCYHPTDFSALLQQNFYSLQ